MTLLPLNWSPKTKWMVVTHKNRGFHSTPKVCFTTISLIILGGDLILFFQDQEVDNLHPIQTKVHKAIAQNSHQYLAPKRWHLLECNAETIERIVPFITLDCFISQFSKDHYYPSKECIIALTEKSPGRKKAKKNFPKKLAKMLQRMKPYSILSF